MSGDFYYAEVISNDDPEQRGRVEVQFQRAGGTFVAWAVVLVMSAGSGYGSQILPEVGERVLVAYPNGCDAEPVVMGALYTGTTSLPEANPSTKVLKTKAGHLLRLSDSGAEEGIELETASGHRISLNDESGEIELSHSSGARVLLSSDTIEIHSSSKIKLSGTIVEVDAASIQLDAAVVNCSGLLTGETLQVNTVIASTYTPGAGNVW